MPYLCVESLPVLAAFLCLQFDDIVFTVDTLSKSRACTAKGIVYAVPEQSLCVDDDRRLRCVACLRRTRIHPAVLAYEIDGRNCGGFF